MRDGEGYEKLAAALNGRLRALLAGTPDLQTFGVIMSRGRGLRQALDAMAGALAANPLHPKRAIDDLSSRHRNILFPFNEGIRRRVFHAGDRDPIFAAFQILHEGSDTTSHCAFIDLAASDDAIADRFASDAAHMLRGVLASHRILGPRPWITTIDRSTMAILEERGTMPDVDMVEHGRTVNGYRQGHYGHAVTICQTDGEPVTWKDGVLTVPGSLPDTVIASATGRRLDAIVDVPAALADRRIKSIKTNRSFRTNLGPAGKAAMKAVLASGPLIHLGPGPTPASTGTADDAFNNDIHVMMLEITVEPERVRIDEPVHGPERSG